MSESTDLQEKEDYLLDQYKRNLTDNFDEVYDDLLANPYFKNALKEFVNPNCKDFNKAAMGVLKAIQYDADLRAEQDFNEDSFQLWRQQ